MQKIPFSSKNDFQNLLVVKVYKKSSVFGTDRVHRHVAKLRRTRVKFDERMKQKLVHLKRYSKPIKTVQKPLQKIIHEKDPIDEQTKPNPTNPILENDYLMFLDK
jgi:uncharacterized membrane protein YgaE (UPF0421/DUF939 family)